MVRLSKRLMSIAEEVPAGSSLADIGSDHALLPSFLAQTGRIRRGVAGEVTEGPYTAAGKQVAAEGLRGLIDVRLGDGLAVISPGEVEVITIAGMGGALIASILEAGKEKLPGVRRLILQPNVGEMAVRSWLLEHGWVLIREQILEEDGKRYEILTAVREEEASVSNEALYSAEQVGSGYEAGRDIKLQMGPYLLRQASPVWHDKWQDEIRKLEMICGQLERSQASASRTKEQEIRQEIHTIQEVLAACTPKAKPSSD